MPKLSPRHQSQLSSVTSPREGAPCSWGSEVRFKPKSTQERRPGPAAYKPANGLGKTFDSLHANPPAARFGTAGLRDFKREFRIKIAAEDRDKPVAEALKNTLERNSGRVIDLFRDWDSDGNGMLDKSEFRVALRRMELYVEDHAADALFDSWDVKGEGELSLQQIQSILKRSRGQLPMAQEAKIFKARGVGRGMGADERQPDR